MASEGASLEGPGVRPGEGDPVEGGGDTASAADAAVESAVVPFEGFSQQLAVDLQAYGAAVEIRAAEFGSLEYERADVRIRPHLSALGAEPKVVEQAGIAWSSWFYWAFTWIGGLAVRDYSYSYVEVRFDVRASEGSLPLDGTPQFSDYPVAMMDRANAWVWCVPCILWPPRWVPDDPERLRASLDTAVRRRAAEELTAFLKHRFEAAALTRGNGSMAVVATAEEAAGCIRLKGKISSRLRPITNVVAIVNGRAEPLESDSTASGWHGDVYEYVLAEPTVAWGGGDVPETITIRAASDQEFSRTVRVGAQ